MRTVRMLSGCLCVALAWNHARLAEAQTPTMPVPPAPTVLPAAHTADGPAPVAAPAGLPTTPQAPGRPPAPDRAAPPAVAPVFAEAAPAGTEAPGGAYAPQMLGDSLAYFSQVNFVNPTSLLLSPGQAVNVLVPVGSLAGSAFKIAENESPRPVDRVWANIDYYTAVYHSLRPGTAPHVRINREVIGGEKTFLGGDASIGIRVPVFEYNDSIGGTNGANLGDVTIVTKFALLRDNDSGSILSAGVCFTLPTGPGTGIIAPGGLNTFFPTENINPTIIQPWVGGIYKPSEQLYIHGFSSLAFPTDDSVPTVWFNDIGAGYYAYRGNCCAVIPTAELHLTTGLGHQGSQGFPVGVVDTLVAILGCHAAWNDGTTVTIGWGFPLTGPQPFANELLLQINRHF